MLISIAELKCGFARLSPYRELPTMCRYAVSALLGVTGIFYITSSLLAQSKQSVLPKPITTTVCEIVGDVQRFDGKKVRFVATFESDGIERSALVDSKCNRGIIPFVPDQVEHHPDIEAFDRALDSGRRGTIDKHVVATFTGLFVVKPSPSSHPRFILEIERIENLAVTMIDLKPHAPP
jgi:hypothetical protein